MSKLFDLLNSVITKIKKTEDAIPKKMSDLEQDVELQSQPDWNQNDESASDYVKNRTHYEEITEVSIEGTEYMVVDGVVSGTTEYSHDDIPFASGQVWKVLYSVDGVWNELSALAYNEAGEIVETTEHAVQIDDNGDFYVVSPISVANPISVTSNTAKYNSNWYQQIQFSEMKVVGVSGFITGEPVVHQIDPKFLPDAIGNLIINITVSYDENDEEVFTVDKTFEEIKSAVDAGGTPIVKLDGEILRLARCEDSFISFSSSGSELSNERDSGYIYGGVVGIDIDNNVSYFFGEGEFPTVGMFERFAEEVAFHTIPTPETASVGQTIVVKAVDENGRPTEWVTSDIPSDDHINDLINTALGVIENGSY